MDEKQYPILQYEEWPPDSHPRWLCAGHAFGAHLMQVRDRALEEIPPNTAPDVKMQMEKLIDIALCRMLALFDQYISTPIGNNYIAQYVLLARICPTHNSRNPVETIELAPDGDGLQMGYWGWLEGKFGQQQQESASI